MIQIGVSDIPLKFRNGFPDKWSLKQSNRFSELSFKQIYVAMFLRPKINLEQMNVAYIILCMLFCFIVGVNDLGALGVTILLQAFLPCSFFSRVRTWLFCTVLIIRMLCERGVLTMFWNQQGKNSYSKQYLDRIIQYQDKGTATPTFILPSMKLGNDISVFT